MMARKGKSGVRPVQIDEQLALATLANETVLGALITGSPSDTTFLVSADLTWGLRGLTAGQGPIECGLAHGDYSDAEVQQCLEAAGSWDLSDKVTQEQARRIVRRVGSFNGLNTEEVLNDGKPIRTRLRFNLEPAEQLKFWAFNQSGAALSTGGVLEVQGTIWVKK